MNDNQPKQIEKLNTAVATLQKVVSNLVKHAQVSKQEIRHLKAKNEFLTHEVSRLSSRLNNIGK